jgi:hypothetical protein
MICTLNIDKSLCGKDLGRTRPAPRGVTPYYQTTYDKF